jgi:hypothetical protein
MKFGHICLLVMLLCGPVASGQNWQDSKSNGGYSFSDVKTAVHRVTNSQMISGWDSKTFNRAGDMAAVAILQTLSDKQMASRETLKMVLVIVRDAFECPNRCVATTSDRQPRVTSLLLDYLHESTTGKLRDDIDETKRFVTKQTVDAEGQNETENR